MPMSYGGRLHTPPQRAKANTRTVEILLFGGAVCRRYWLRASIVQNFQDELKELFNRCGEVRDIYIHSVNDKPYQYGFIRYGDISSVMKAVVELNRWPLNGSEIKVEIASECRDILTLAARAKKLSRKAAMNSASVQAQIREACTQLNETLDLSSGEINPIDSKWVLDRMMNSRPGTSAKLTGAPSPDCLATLERIRTKLLNGEYDYAIPNQPHPKAKNFFHALKSMTDDINDYVEQHQDLISNLDADSPVQGRSAPLKRESPQGIRAREEAQTSKAISSQKSYGFLQNRDGRSDFEKVPTQKAPKQHSRNTDRTEHSHGKMMPVHRDGLNLQDCQEPVGRRWPQATENVNCARPAQVHGNGHAGDRTDCRNFLHHMRPMQRYGDRVQSRQTEDFRPFINTGPFPSSWPVRPSSSFLQHPLPCSGPTSYGADRHPGYRAELSHPVPAAVPSLSAGPFHPHQNLSPSPRQQTFCYPWDRQNSGPQYVSRGLPTWTPKPAERGPTPCGTCLSCHPYNGPGPKCHPDPNGRSPEETLSPQKNLGDRFADDAASQRQDSSDQSYANGSDGEARRGQTGREEHVQVSNENSLSRGCQSTDTSQFDSGNGNLSGPAPSEEARDAESCKAAAGSSIIVPDELQRLFEQQDHSKLDSGEYLAMLKEVGKANASMLFTSPAHHLEETVDTISSDSGTESYDSANGDGSRFPTRRTSTRAEEDSLRSHPACSREVLAANDGVAEGVKKADSLRAKRAEGNAGFGVGLSGPGRAVPSSMGRGRALKQLLSSEIIIEKVD
ncbi:hypothetical protein BaRGS_00018893 [Batillaria attramentaria]|uniref:RRM domain-containing protein n=1 Tax=Batillaria attramentaria TaxID=370345 RepID=A0ABD0KS12_9CAEN